MANPNIVSVTSINGESVGYNLTATTTTTLLTVSSDKLLKINRITCANVEQTQQIYHYQSQKLTSHRQVLQTLTLQELSF